MTVALRCLSQRLGERRISARYTCALRYWYSAIIRLFAGIVKTGTNRSQPHLKMSLEPRRSMAPLAAPRVGAWIEISFPDATLRTQ